MMILGIMQLLKQWTHFEIIWLFSFLSLGLITTYLNQGNLLGYATLVSGIFCVVLAAKANILNYWFGLFNSCAYGYICYNNGLYGEMGLNLFFFLPTAVLGIVLWRKHITDQQLTQAQTVSHQTLMMILGITALGIVVLGYALSQLEHQNLAYLDASVTVLSITATLLMLGRYQQQWLFYIVLNIITIILWFFRANSGSPEAIMMLLMWTAFLINAIYGYFNWLKLVKQQQISN